MELPVAIGLLIVGIALLAVGGEALVRGAVAISVEAGLPAAVIGLTVVAMGTSLPELVVSVVAAMRGTPDLAVGNVVGSNIFNVTAALGLAVLVAPAPVRASVVRLEWPVMVIACLVCAGFLRDASIGRFEGGILVTGLALFVSFSVYLARREVRDEVEVEFEEELKEHALPGGKRRWMIAIGFVLLGIVLLTGGGRLLVHAAVEIARLAGMTERVIGLTVVAAGTGIPEVATSIVAAVRGRIDVAVANMIGSNIFNVLGILGVTALVQPLTVSLALVEVDLLWMIATAILIFPFLRSGWRLIRIEGGVMVAAYVVYIAQLLL